MIGSLQIADVLAWVLVTIIQIATAAGIINRFYGNASRSLGLLAGFVLFACLNVIYFHAMMLIASYNVQGMVACSLLGLAVVWRYVPRWDGRISLISSSLPRLLKLSLLLCLPMVLLRLVRSAAVPPLTWDALTYHLVKPAHWIHDAAFLRKPAPESWAYYEFFSYYAEILFSQAMLFTRNEGLVWLVEWAYTFMAALAVYALCNLRNIEKSVSLLAALSTMLCPAILNWLPSSHVDTMAAGFLVAAIAFGSAMAIHQEHRPMNFALALISVSLSCGMKNSMLPYCALITLMLIATAWTKLRFRQLLPLALLPAIAIPPYARAWCYTGNPLYPIPLNLGPMELEGNSQFVLLLTHGTTGKYSWPEFWRYFDALLAGWKHLTFNGGRVEYLNFGFPAIGIILLALVGLFQSIRQKGMWLSTLMIVGIVAVNIWAWFSPMANVQGSWWLEYAGRFLLPAYLGMVVLASSVNARITRYILAALCLGQIVYHIPRGIDHSLEWPYLTAIAVVLCISIALLFLQSRLIRNQLSRMITLLIIAVISLAVIQGIRSHARWNYYGRLKDGKLFLQQGLSGTNSPEWAIWKDLSNKSAAIINVSAGFGNGGLNWYRYPLFGDHFQHTLVYVSPYENNELVNGDDKVKPSLVTADAWLQRLQQAGVRYAAALGPRHPEYQWMDDRRDLFYPISRSASGASTLYIVKSHPAGKSE